MSDCFSTGLNLNLPPESNGQKGHGGTVDVNVEPMDGVDPFIPDTSHPSHGTAESVKPVVDEPLITCEGIGSQVGSLVGGDGVPLPASEVSAPVSYPIIDFSEPAPVSYPIIDLSEPSPVTEMQAPPVVTEDERVEQALLMELEEMGFKQTDLNKEILRKNEYDMEQSVDDLCGFAEWDPILEELQEMVRSSCNTKHRCSNLKSFLLLDLILFDMKSWLQGFSDRQLNKKLLIKNGGSIKRVVLALIAGVKA